MIIAVSALLMAGVAAAVATATYHGGNGVVAYDDGSVFPSRIGIVNPDGTGERTLSQRGDHWPRWSPDGKKIVFFSTRDDSGATIDAAAAEIFTMDADGSSQTQLTFNDVEDQTPEWTPDGRIVFTRRAGPGHWDIWIMNADATDQRQLTDLGGVSAWPAPSPRGRELAFASNYLGRFHIFTIRVDGTHLREVTNDALEDWGAEWSPTGNDIAFTREVPDPSTSAGAQEHVWVVHRDGSDPRQITSDPARADTFPTWSPDGNYVIFYGATDWFGPNWHSTIVAHSLATGSESTIGRPDIGGAPAWQPLRLTGQGG
jgi:TolB protein